MKNKSHNRSKNPLENTFSKQLQKVGVKNVEEVTFSIAVTLISNVIESFTEEKISIDELSTIFATLWEEFYLHRSDEDKDTFSEIMNILESGKELSYYSQDVNPIFISSLQHIFKLYIQRESVKENVLAMEKQ